MFIDIEKVNQKDNTKCMILNRGTRIIKSAFGLSIINDQDMTSVDLPQEMISELASYMAFKPRDDKTYEMLVNMAKNYAQNHPTFKKMSA